MVSKEQREAFEKMGKAPLSNTQWTESDADKETANLYVDDLTEKMVYNPPVKPSRKGEFDPSKAAISTPRQELTTSNKLFPTSALYYYLLRPIRETLIELFSGTRVTTNLLKLLGGAIFIAAFVTAVFFFPPIASLASPAGIGPAIAVFAPLAITGIAIFNSVISGIEQFARKRHWDRYENFSSTVKRWDKAFFVSKDTLSNMNAYLLNKLQDSKNKRIKKMFTKLIDKQLDVGDKIGAHAVGIFFAKELEMLVQAKKNIIAETDKCSTMSDSQSLILIALQTDLDAVKEIVQKLKVSHVPEQTRTALTKVHWKEDIESRMGKLEALLAGSLAASQNKNVESQEIFLSLGGLTSVESGVALIKSSEMVFSEPEKAELIGWINNLSKFKEASIVISESAEVKALEETLNQAMQQVISGPKP